jgi:processive 1,2-diacylglycerol beta-glucosyltransferase
MKITILTGKFGMGHMSVAKAIEEKIIENHLEAEVEIIDWINYVSPKLANRCYTLFEILVKKGCKLYNTRYRLLENKKTNQKPELYNYFKWYFKKFMEEKQPDIIISTLPLCSQITSLYKEKTGSSITLITCVTDITGHSEWINNNTDIYMIGSNYVKEKFLKKGVSPEKIFVTGIPVRLGFTKLEPYEKVNREKDNKVKDNRKLLVMGGGLGLLPVDSEFYNGLDLLNNVEVTIITGKNQTLYNSLKGKYKNIRVVGYVNNVYDYMKQADAIITKPGGVTTFEAIAAGVPILALNPFLQQEINNSQYIKDMCIGAIICGNDKKCLQEIADILNRKQLDIFRTNIQKINSSRSENLYLQVLKAAVKRSNQIANRGFALPYNQIIEESNVNEKVSFNV